MNDNTERMISPEHLQAETYLEKNVRPSSFDDFVGQARLIENLKIFVKAAKTRNEPIDHILFCGPPGLGKTSLAFLLAKESNVTLHGTSGPALEKKGDLAGLLTNLSKGDILFIDEIHRLHTALEENLYSAMEDFQFDFIIGEGPHARTIKLDIPPFTLIGATTRSGLLSSPLRDRFGMICHLEFYTIEELAKIVSRSARLLQIRYEEDGIQEIAKRSRGTPRIANRILRRIRDFAQVIGNGSITAELVKKSLIQLEIDHHGLDAFDRKLLQAIVMKFDGGPVGIDALASTLGEETDTLEDVYEPYLIQEGFILRTHRGRIASPKAYAHLQVPPKKNTDPQLDLSLESSS